MDGREQGRQQSREEGHMLRFMDGGAGDESQSQFLSQRQNESWSRLDRMY
jgi:hypothetical protein